MGSCGGRDGAVILVNGGNGIFVTVRALEMIGDQPDIAAITGNSSKGTTRSRWSRFRRGAP